MREAAITVVDYIFPKSVEHHDCVIHAVSDDRQHRYQEHCIHFQAHEVAQNRENPYDDQQVMDQRYDRRQPIPEGARHAPERPPEIYEDADRGSYDRIDSVQYRVSCNHRRHEVG